MLNVSQSCVYITIGALTGLLAGEYPDDRLSYLHIDEHIIVFQIPLDDFRDRGCRLQIDLWQSSNESSSFESGDYLHQWKLFAELMPCPCRSSRSTWGLKSSCVSCPGGLSLVFGVVVLLHRQDAIWPANRFCGLASANVIIHQLCKSFIAPQTRQTQRYILHLGRKSRVAHDEMTVSASSSTAVFTCFAAWKAYSRASCDSPI